MNTHAISSFFVLFAIVAGVAAAPAAFADHVEVTVSAPAGSSVPGCEETNECFIDADVTVDVGGKVVWSNDDTAAHTVTSGSPEDGPSGFFDSSLFMAGTTFEHTFDEAGDYPYFCMVHPWMQGTVTVGAAMAASDGAMVLIETTPGNAGETMDVTVTITDMDGNSVEHVNYNVMATQGDETILDDTGVHDHDGVMTHTSMALPMAASDEMPVDVSVEFLGFGLPDDDPSTWTGPIGQMETAQVVPEFGTIAALILVVAIVSIIAVTAKSKLSLMPRI